MDSETTTIGPHPPSGAAAAASTAVGPEVPAGGEALPGGEAAVRLEAVTKTYGRRARARRALDGVTLAIPTGSFTAVMGPSGSGKSTLLQCAAGLEAPTSGHVHLGPTPLAGMDETELTELRRDRVGFVFQAFNLLPALTVRQNVELPLRLGRKPRPRAVVEEVLAQVGLSGRGGDRPSELSGGQQQRVAVARALVTRPDVLFGDEPTGALDTVTAKGILGLLRACVDGTGQTVVMVTHDPVAASHADTVLFLADGRIAGREDRPTADAVAARMTHLGAWGP